MKKPNILNHVPHNIVDESNVWKSDQITDIPVYTPNSISIPNGIKIFNGYDRFDYAFNIGNKVTLLYGLDKKGRYTFLELEENKTFFRYKFGGRSFPQARNWSCVRLDDNYLYLSGGLLDNDPIDDIWRYDIENNIWELIGNLVSPRWKHSMYFTDDKIFIFGGQTKSKLDNRYLVLNDIFWCYKDSLDDWNILDREALLPHVEGSIIGVESDIIYLLINNTIWSVNGDITTELSGNYDIKPYLTDVRYSDNKTYFLAKDTYNDQIGDLYSWNYQNGFELIQDDSLLIPDDKNDNIYLLGNNIFINDQIIGGVAPPIDQNISHCQTENGRAYFDNGILYLFSFENMHTESVEINNENLPLTGYVTCNGSNIYITGWKNDVLKTGLYDPDLNEYTHISDSESVPYREKTSFCIVQNTLWMMSGETDEEGYINDQWKLNLNDIDPEWELENTLSQLPEQPFDIFEWRERLWLIPHAIRCLYRYYPSMKQWTPVYISRSDTEHQELGLFNKNNRWSVVDNRLMIEPRGYYKINILLESRTARDVIYKGKLWFGIDRAHVVTDDGRLFLADGTEMQTAIPDSPPHFENSSYLNNNMGTTLIEKHPYMMWGYNDLGEYLPCYSDLAGFFWIDNVNARIKDPDENNGFYVSESDYNGKLGDYYRRLPSFIYKERNKEPLFTALYDIEYSDSRFVLSHGKITRYRTQDGTYFEYNAPVSEGAACACSEDGQVYIFGGISGNRVISQNQQGIEEYNKCQSTLVVYDLNYASGEIEYLSNIPEFYERHDYALAADYLISRLKQSLPLGNASESARVDKLLENYYNSAQAIIDDIAVRYVTYEGGARPNARAYPISCQIGNKLFVGGGTCPFTPKASGSCPVLTQYLDYDLDSGESLSDFNVFDMDTKSWSKLSSLPTDHLFYASVAVTPDQTEIWVVGGYTSSDMTNRSKNIFIYDVLSDKWNTISETPKAYTGRAKPGLQWIDDDTLLILYGSRCDITTSGCPKYWFNSMGDSWIIHRPSGGMYKYDSDLPKTFTIMPSDQDRSYVELLYLPAENPPPGGHTDIVENLALARMLSEDWTAYEEHYSYNIDNIYDQLKEKYKDIEFYSKDGEAVSIPFIESESALESLLRIINIIIPDIDPAEIINIYDRDVFTPGDMTQIPDTVLPIGYISIFEADFMRAIIFILSTREKDLKFIEQYEVTYRDIFTVLDTLSNELYPLNRITATDPLIIQKSINTGEYLNVKKIVAPQEMVFDVGTIKEIFHHKSGDWWLVGYYSNNLRFYRFTERLDGDMDLTLLPVDLPISGEPLAIGYNGQDHIICLFDKFNIWQLNIQTAIINPNADYWRRLPPELSIGDKFTNNMRSLMMPNNIILFVNENGLVLRYDILNFIWDTVRDEYDSKNSYVVIDNTELYYIGNDPSYFNCNTYQGDRFMVNTDICETGIGTNVLPRLSVEHNMIMGFDINNNLVSAFTRKQGTFDKSWKFDNYYYIKQILISVDYDSLDNDFEVYLRTQSGIIIGNTYKKEAVEPWNFNEFTRYYENGNTTSQLPEQYIAVDVDDYVSELQVIYVPPIKNFGYVARVNGVILVPEIYDGDLRSNNYFIACKDTSKFYLSNLSETGMNIELNVDNLDLALSIDEKIYSEKIDYPLPGRKQQTIHLKALSEGKIVYLMGRNIDK